MVLAGVGFMLQVFTARIQFPDDPVKKMRVVFLQEKVAHPKQTFSTPVLC